MRQVEQGDVGRVGEEERPVSPIPRPSSTSTWNEGTPKLLALFRSIPILTVQTHAHEAVVSHALAGRTVLPEENRRGGGGTLGRRTTPPWPLPEAPPVLPWGIGQGGTDAGR